MIPSNGYESFKGPRASESKKNDNFARRNHYWQCVLHIKLEEGKPEVARKDAFYKGYAACVPCMGDDASVKLLVSRLISRVFHVYLTLNDSGESQIFLPTPF